MLECVKIYEAKLHYIDESGKLGVESEYGIDEKYLQDVAEHFCDYCEERGWKFLSADFYPIISYI